MLFKRLNGKSCFIVMSVAILAVLTWAGPATAFSGSGFGTEGDPYVITDVYHLHEMRDDLEAYYVLGNDIDACDTLNWNDGEGFEPVGQDPSFSGFFDGGGYVITDLYIYRPTEFRVGLFGLITDGAEIKNVGLVDANITAHGTAGTLVGYSRSSKVTNAWSSGSMTGTSSIQYGIGGLIGASSGPGAVVSGCCSFANVTTTGINRSGGLIGFQLRGSIIADCYATGDVTGRYKVGGLIGDNTHGEDGGYITRCYSTGKINGSGGGLVGHNYMQAKTYDSYWDTMTSGKSSSFGGMGRTTDEMMQQATFIGWDFDTPVWTIDEGVDYPRLWWESIPALHTEPEITLGTSNIILWAPVVGGVEYYLECAEDTNFTSIVSNSGWITETSCEFIDLQLGQQYWYRVRAGNAAGVETGWSNVESSLQSTLGDAVDMLLDPASLKNENMKNALLNKMDAAMAMIDEGLYEDALDKLEHDILAKTNGCAETGEPDKNDWILTCEQQGRVYGLVMETIEYVRSLIE